MDRDTLILLVDESSTGIDSIHRAVADRANHFRVQRVADVPTALARIWGGGVDMVLVNLPAVGSSESDRLVPFLELRSKAQGIPIVVLCGSAEQSLAERAIREGAADYLIREAYDADLLRVLRSVAGKIKLLPGRSRPAAAAGKGGKVLVFMGSKGGSGATTVALNVAAALAQDRSVILAELHSELGTLSHYFQPHRSIHDIGDLSYADDGIPGAQEVETRLWPCKNVPGLQVLFGSRNLENARSLSPGNVRAILTELTESADYVVADLPVSLSAANRAVMEDAALFAFVVERDPISVQAAKLMLRALDSWKAARVSIGAVIVNRTALVSPMPLAEIQAELPIPILGVIPPAADLCAAAQHAHTPLVTLDADSLPAIALRELSQAISQQVPLARATELAGAAGIPMRTPSHGMHRAGVR